ncbi:uncharacterized protein KY384_003520 [Bacidia gigantensis]|uniref:uncharacterized protein n=1 Tax=Bacidia gigantensis TaxID=2732470 RepID=UPI001D05A8F0|nr:uncharacterized protein KY384_003520 [Bacidia gigantensis]KAG8531884.1 hypothetical protein KY384_003520 [Bacidia gigantensis]
MSLSMTSDTTSDSSKAWCGRKGQRCSYFGGRSHANVEKVGNFPHCELKTFLENYGASFDWLIQKSTQGLFAGFTATYILRDSWRHQLLSGAIPAFALLLLTWVSCESPRWLIIQGKYEKAFTTLVRLRKERVIAAKELCSIYYQIQAERWLFSAPEVKVAADLEATNSDETEGLNPFEPELPRTSYWRRLINHYTFPRIRRAAIAAMVVMLSQQLSGDYFPLFSHYLSVLTRSGAFLGINVIAFLATNFFSSAQLRKSTPEEAKLDSYKLAIGFGAVNALASAWAYFLVENKEEPRAVTEIESEYCDDKESMHDNGLHRPSTSEEEEVGDTRNDFSNRFSAAGASVRFQDDEEIINDGDSSIDGQHHGLPLDTLQRDSRVLSETSSLSDVELSESDDTQLYTTEKTHQFRGRRFLLLLSLFGGVFTLLITALCFNIPEGNSARLPLVALFIMIFTVFYSLGAGAIAFLYCAEVFPNEGREIGMSWSTFWNFSGAGTLALFVPFGINWGHGKLLGLFSGFNAVAFILVWFLVPSTNQTATLEDMSYIFGRKLRQHAKAQLKRLNPYGHVTGAKIQWLTAQSGAGSRVRMRVAWERRHHEVGPLDEKETVGPEDGGSKSGDGKKVDVERTGEKAPYIRELRFERRKSAAEGANADVIEVLPTPK